jgi:hypothetical protein
MFGFVKMAALSAVLSYGVVNAYGPVTAAEPASSKVFHDRILPSDEVAGRAMPAVQTTGTVSRAPIGEKTDRLVKAAPCETQAWSSLAEDCLARKDGAAAPKRVRVITIESREEANVSVLARVRQADFAQR